MRLALTLSLAAEDLKRVDALILARASGEVPLIHEITQHLVSSGGKRLRPMLTLLCARACGYAGLRHIGLAAAVELITLGDALAGQGRRVFEVASDMIDTKAEIAWMAAISTRSHVPVTFGTTHFAAGLSTWLKVAVTDLASCASVRTG